MTRVELRTLLETRTANVASMIFEAKKKNGAARQKTMAKVWKLQSAVEVAWEIYHEEQDDLKAEERIKAIFLATLP